jgi:hypothetical protein
MLDIVRLVCTATFAHIAQSHSKWLVHVMTDFAACDHPSVLNSLLFQQLYVLLLHIIHLLYIARGTVNDS